ncbi:UNKNOWN [Stylonychia lemnae]|uniref:Uncharacterized protein n=1 Tax=Stylonychia lemnae TaxID=5949 RepID=A0A077ZVU0_STYLE|nr:UNKNOWN [Stylonychia lemnae]|eukprot:CDW74070.1 UNKNOWN [Stylonychia lemnae]
MDGKKSSHQNSQRALKNPVHQMKIYEEFIHKEKNYSHRNKTEEFNMRPQTIHNISEKPNHITPVNPYLDKKTESLNDDVVDRAFRIDAMRRQIQSAGLQPRQKYPHAMTSNQEIGWYSNPLVPQNKAWQFNRLTTPITDYAEDYLSMKKVNPFTVRNR